MYGTVEGADAYHLARGNSTWGAASESARTAALIRGSDYIDARYILPFYAGEPTWTTTPARVEQAAYEAALAELQTPRVLTPIVTSDGRKVLTEVKGIKWTLVSSGSGGNAWWPTIPIIDGLLSGLVGTSYLPAILVV